MSIKSINGNQNPNIIKQNNDEENKTNKAKGSSAINPAAINAYGKAASQKPGLHNSANIQISDRAKDINLAHKAIKESPDIREENLEKIEKLKQLIQKGEYKIDPEKIADGMIKEAIKDEIAKVNK